MMTELAHLAFAVTILLVFSPAPASAKVLQFNCSYQKFYNGQDNRLEDASDFNLQFTLDTLTNKAVLIGNQGVEDVAFVSGDAGITFLEYLPTGAVQTTTVSKGGASVHSRHTLIAGEFSPSQYYGSCR
jgi:hypothetical protein